MLYHLSIPSALLMASLAYGNHMQFAHHGSGSSMAKATVSGTNIDPMFSTVEGYLIPSFMLDEEMEITPEEAQLRRLKMRKLFKRLPTSWVKKIKAKKFTSVTTKEVKIGEKLSEDLPFTDTTTVDDASDIAPDDEEIITDAFPSKKSGGKKKGGKKSGGKPKVEKCSEGRLATLADVKAALVGDCADFQGKKVLRNKSAHNCKGKLYQCNGRCGRPSNFPGVETGVCIV
ncbi:hypothetical protein K7432_017454 [Basidiobolus ranarum]|uniref:Uncharacterized protein n=1 Tax=Basidiobolus ranarum TaxID=34480 RepID=A0ABR2WDD4_9FUNG